VYVLPGYNLPVAHVMVAVTPEWRGGVVEDRDLVRCYRGMMDMAWRMDIQRLAVSVAGVGRHQFALPRAARLILQGLRERMPGTLQEVRIVCESAEIYAAFAERIKSLKEEL
jgi:O-acetyl-ADP-ribose deacetylase (regulator of RNase III)